MERVIKRPDYDTNSVNNDIALLRLAQVVVIIFLMIMIRIIMIIKIIIIMTTAFDRMWILRAR